MNKLTRKRRHDRRVAHQRIQKTRKQEALAESEARSRSAKKGKKGVISEMLKRGYIQDGPGWKRIYVPKQDG